MEAPRLRLKVYALAPSATHQESESPAFGVIALSHDPMPSARTIER